MFNFGEQNPSAPRTTADTVGTAGTLIGDWGGALNAAATVEHNAGMAGQVGSGAGFVGNVMLGMSELAQGQYAGGLGDIGAGVMSGVGYLNPELAASTPGLGVAAGAMTAVGHGVEAYRHRDEIDGGYQNNQFWTETGYATFGAANALAALDPTGIASLYVGGTQLALDGLGALSGAVLGEDYRFTSGSAVGAAEHLAFDSGQWLAQEGMQAGHWVGENAPRAWNAATSAVGNAATAVGNTASNAWNGATHMASGALDTVGNAASSAGSAISRGWHSLTGW